MGRGRFLLSRGDYYLPSRLVEILYLMVHQKGNPEEET
jgi:hypothetical protein